MSMSSVSKVRLPNTLIRCEEKAVLHGLFEGHSCRALEATCQPYTGAAAAAAAGVAAGAAGVAGAAGAAGVAAGAAN